MRTLADVRHRLAEQLAMRTAAPLQLDVHLCEDNATVLFLLHLTDDDALAATLDLPENADPEFIALCFAAPSLWRWH